VGYGGAVHTEITATADGGKTWDILAPPVPLNGLPNGPNNVSAISRVSDEQ
jgi:hypothetical protein